MKTKFKIVSLLIVLIMIFTCACSSGDKPNSDTTSTSDTSSTSDSGQSEVLDGAVRLSLPRGEVSDTSGNLKDQTLNQKYNNFSADILLKSYEAGSNALVSPLSIIMAMGMLMDGAGGTTLQELETFFGMTTEEIDNFSSGAYYRYMEEDSVKPKINLTNSLWINSQHLGEPDTNPVKTDYLQKVSLNYNADIYKLPFNSNTSDTINAFVSDKTDGMIKDILPPDSVKASMIMFIVNTLLLKDKWAEEGVELTQNFTDYSGKTSPTTFLRLEGNSLYENDNVKVVDLRLQSRNYALRIILPTGSIDDYLNNFTENYLSLLEDRKGGDRTTGIVKLPKFSYDVDLNLKEIMQESGVTEVFEYGCDLDKINDGAFVAFIKHSAKIEVNKEGLSAAAATIIGVDNEVSPCYDFFLDIDKPFIYTIVDTYTETPLFMGVLNTL